MIRKLGNTIFIDFCTADPITGAVVDCDSLPEVEVFKDADDTAMSGSSVVKREGKTGDYRISIAASIDNGFEVEKSYNVVLSYIVNEVQKKVVVSTFTLELGSGSGSNLLEINTVLGSNIAVYSDLTRVAVGVSNLTGAVSFLLDSGMYDIVCQKAGYLFPNPTVVDVTNDMSIEIVGEQISIDSPNPSESCRVWEFCFKPDGVSPASVITATATVTNVPPDATDKMIAYETIVGTYVPSTGQVYWDLIYGAKFRFEIKELRVSCQKIIPATPSARLTDIP